jgi:Rrf2 family iron-sulfur cluster assembly transcriptional regulator
MIRFSLTSTAEYALRAMAQLALAPQGETVMAGPLAEKTGVPLHYLRKIMRKLVSAGLVESSKGHGGGFRLSKPAERICFMDVLEVTGYESQPNQCVFGWGECRSDKPCPMHRSWSDLNEEFVSWAKGTTLASLSEPRAKPKARASRR